MSSKPPEIFGSKPPVGTSADLTRILGLPRRPPVEPGTVQAEALIEHVTAKYSKNIPSGSCGCSAVFARWKVPEKPCITRLNYAQAWMLHEITINSGLVAHAAVGCGKTVVDLLAAQAMPNCKIAVLFIPPTLSGQLAREWELLDCHFNVSSIYIHYPIGKKKEWEQYRPGTPLLHVLPYSRLSRKEATVYLEQFLKPDAIFADECQHLSNLEAVRTGRLVRYFETFGDSIRMGVWSGSLFGDEIQNATSLSALSLKKGSPMPLYPKVADEWGTALNPDDWRAPAGALSALCAPGEDLDEGFHRRLAETPGFVITSGASIETPLEIREREAPPLPDVPRQDEKAPGIFDVIEAGWWPGVKTALTAAREKWVRPDGEILLDALQASRCARELACGLFLKWKFIRGETKPEIQIWRDARKEWRSEMREKLKERIPHMDSPELLANAAMRAWGHKPGPGGVIDMDEEGNAVIALPEHEELPHWKAETWPAWALVKKTVQPITEAVRLDPFLANDAALWASENLGIVWYATVAFGKWVSEISGFPLHEGGPKAGERLSREKGDRSIICSIKSHGTGRDGLQRLFSTQLIAQPPSSAVLCEQLLGRLSRVGQEADIVHALLYRHTDEIRAQFDSAMRKTLFVQKLLNAPQRLTTSWME